MVVVSKTTASGPSFNLSAPPLPITLSPGQTASLLVHFSPATAGSVTGGVSVVSNASNSPLTIALTGNGVTQILSASPSSLSFGNIRMGTSGTLPVVVANTGSASVTISQTTTTGAGFSVSGPALPLTLAAGQNTSFSVIFDPTTTGSATGNLSIASTATDSPNLESLSATGVNQHSVTLSWAPSTSPNIMGYNVYRAAVSGGPYAKLNSSLLGPTTYTDAAVEAGETYYYVTTAVDSRGVESADSNQAAVIIPSP
jgi:hypothetical protein